MYMHIHQPGAHGQSPGIDHPGVGLVDVAPDDRYLSVLNQHIHNPADAPNRVNQPSLPYQQLHEITPFTLKPFQTAMQSTAKRVQVHPRPLHKLNRIIPHTLYLETQFLATDFLRFRQ